jgi:nitronate monooxygenase
MVLQTPLSQRLGLKGPLFAAPLGGGPTGPELVAAAANAGALGIVAGAYLQPDELDASIKKTRALTSRNFAVNLFAPQTEAVFTPGALDTALAAMRPLRAALGLRDPDFKPPYHPDFDRQFAVVLQHKPMIFSFVFGLLTEAHMHACRAAGILTMGTAASLDDALALQESGADIVVAQGIEAGGHRAMFDMRDRDPMLGTEALTAQLAARLRVPVVAAGGMMDGRGITAAIRHGAQAAMLGTAFLACDEAATSTPYRRALLDPQRAATRLTRGFSGRWARGIDNRFMRHMAAHESSILPFLAQNALTRDIRAAGTQADRPDFLSLWAGTGVAPLRISPAASLIEALFMEMAD